jgi:hypothetical protein
MGPGCQSSPHTRSQWLWSLASGPGWSESSLSSLTDPALSSLPSRSTTNRAQLWPSFSAWADQRVLREPVAVSAVKSPEVSATNRELCPPFDYLEPGRRSLHSTRGHRAPSLLNLQPPSPAKAPSTQLAAAPGRRSRSRLLPSTDPSSPSKEKRKGAKSLRNRDPRCGCTCGARPESSA